MGAVPGETAIVRPVRAAVLRTTQAAGSSINPFRSVMPPPPRRGQATTGAANAGAVMSAAAPWSRGCSIAATGRISVVAAAAVSVRSARQPCTAPSTRSQASVISPPMYTQPGLNALMTDASPR